MDISYLYVPSMARIVGNFNCAAEWRLKFPPMRCIEGMYSYRKDDWWRSKLGREKHLMLWRSSCLSHYMNDRIARLSLLQYLSTSVFPALLPLKGTLFLPVFFSSFRARSRFAWFLSSIRHFVSQSPFLFFFCQLYFLIKHDIFVLQ